MPGRSKHNPTSAAEAAKHVLDLRLDSFDWLPRELLCLKSAKLHTVRDLVTKTEAWLLGIPGVGGAMLRSFKDFAEDLGFKLEKGRFFESGGPKSDGFSMPRSEYSLIEMLSWRAWQVRCSKIEERGYDYRHYYNKSETLRAGLAALTRLSDDELINLYEGLPLPRKGSITNEEMQARAELEELPRHRRGPQIDYVLDKFDFDGTCAAMRKLKMYWNFPGEKRPRTPTPGELSKKAEELLEIAIEDGLAEDGGLLAIKRMGVLHLIFAPQHQAGTLQPPIETSKQ